MQGSHNKFILRLIDVELHAHQLQKLVDIDAIYVSSYLLQYLRENFISKFIAHSIALFHYLFDYFKYFFWLCGDCGYIYDRKEKIRRFLFFILWQRQQRSSFNGFQLTGHNLLSAFLSSEKCCSFPELRLKKFHIFEIKNFIKKFLFYFRIGVKH